MNIENKINELNDVYAEKLKMGLRMERKLNFEVEINEYEKYITLIDRKRKVYFALKPCFGMSMNNHKVVEFVHYEKKSTNKKIISPLVKSYDTYIMAFDLLKDYWIEMAKLEGYEGVIFVVQKNEELVRFAQEYLPSQQEDISLSKYKNQEFFEEVSDVTNCKVIGAYIKEKALERLGNINHNISVFNAWFVNEPTANIEWGISVKKSIFSGQINIVYEGISIAVKFNKEYDGMYLSTGFESPTVEVPVSLSNLEEYVEEVIKRNRAKNLINPPKGNFRNWMYRLFSTDPGMDESVGNQFSSLVESYGDWEEVEEIAVELMKESNPEKYMEVKENVRHRNIKIFKYQHKGKNWFIANMKCRFNANVLCDKSILKIIISGDESPLKLTMLVNEWLTLDNKEIMRLY